MSKIYSSILAMVVLLGFLGGLCAGGDPSDISKAPAQTESKQFDLGQWVSGYYKDPSPDLYVAGLREVFASGLHLKEDQQLVTTVFFSQLVAANPNRIGRWVKELGTMDKKQESFFQYILWLCGSETAGKYMNEKMKSKIPPVIYKLEPENPSVLDANWSYFLATGRKEPIRNIIRALRLAQDGISVKEYKASAQTAEDEQKLWMGLTFEAARSSLISYCSKHDLVMRYCRDIYKSQKLHKQEKIWLAKILSEVARDK